MAFLGHQGGLQLVSVGGPVNQTTGGSTNGTTGATPGDMVVIDGTPVRVVVLALAAAAALTAFRWGGIRFNVGVSS